MAGEIDKLNMRSFREKLVLFSPISTTSSASILVWYLRNCLPEGHLMPYFGFVTNVLLLTENAPPGPFKVRQMSALSANQTRGRATHNLPLTYNRTCTYVLAFNLIRFVIYHQNHFLTPPISPSPYQMSVHLVSIVFVSCKPFTYRPCA
jgi:hypothetical protein